MLRSRTHKREWRNWQTRTFEGRVVNTVRVQFPFPAPTEEPRQAPRFFCFGNGMRSRTEVFGPNGTASLRSPRKLLSPWRLYGVQFPFPAPTKKELLSTKSSFFVYPSRRLGISSRRSRGYHQGRRAALVSHHAPACIFPAA